MAYRTLKAQFHAKGEQGANELYRRRIDSESTLKWEFLIGQDPAFCVLTPELMLLHERVFLLDKAISTLWSQLPLGASVGYLNTLLVREIEATNDIEDVRSTRQEITEALRAKLDDGGSKKRFQELARLYKALLGQEYPLPQDAKGIRVIFDAITDGELEADDLIEGPLFRLGSTRIMGGTKVIHQGLPASVIESRIEDVIAVLNSTDVPGLMATMVSHFMFEYIHPFYDGNGRTGRFLMAQKLQTVVSTVSALTLSSSINVAKHRYYKAFENAEHKLNRGDLTPFVTEMLNFLLESQGEMLRDLEARKLLFDDLSEQIHGRNADSAKQVRQNQELFILGQVWLFDETRVIQLDELAAQFKETKQTIRNDLSVLEDAGLVEISSPRPLTVTLTEEACRELGLKNG